MKKLPTLDLAGTKGVGRRKLDAAPTAFREAFDPESGADDASRARACELVRALVSGEEGAFTTAGARVLAVAIDALLTADVARADLLSELALDLAYGDQPVDLAPLPEVALRAGAAKAVRAVVSERRSALVAGLRATRPEARGLSAWLLLSMGAIDDAVLGALQIEREPGVRAVLVAALAGFASVDRSLLRASLSPPAPPSEQAAAAFAWWSLDGDSAPDAVPRVLLAARDHERASPGFPWRLGPGRLGLRRVLATDTAGRALIADWLLHDIEASLAARRRDKLAADRAFGELGGLLRALLPAPLPPADALSVLARRAVEVTTSTFFLGRRDYGDLGLPETVAGRRAWLGLSSPRNETDSLAKVTRWAAIVEETEESVDVTEPEARAALSSLPPAERSAWAHQYLATRRSWPGATRAPNGASTLLALEQLDARALDSVWVRDHEPILAALSVEGPGPSEVFSRIPLARRPHVWRAWVALHPNPNVAFREGARFAPACPTRDVALGLVALAAVATQDDLAALLPATLGAMGEAGAAARARITTLAAAMKTND